MSGTHGSGKTTLVEDFLAVHPDYQHEPEPYEWLEDDAMSAEPTADDFLRQLEISVERLSSYGRGANVIAERSPLDFVAYLRALGHAEIASAEELAAAGMAHVDLLVILPLDGTIEIPESEDLELRGAMNDRLLELAQGVEIQGSRAQRLRLLEEAAGLR